MKKILLIAYHYYPDTAVGAQRTVKYAKYLPAYGWKPSVLTVRAHHYGRINTAELEFDCPVYRTAKLVVPDDIYRALKRWVSSVRRSGSPTDGESGTTFRSDRQKLSFLKKLFNSLSGTPDNFVGWYLPSVLKGLTLIQERRFDAIYTSGPPHSTHLTGLTLHRLTGVPWVADFRDPWLYEREEYNQVLPVSRWFDERFERRLAERASLVITTTDEWRDTLKKRYSPTLNHKCYSVINGFDEDDFQSFRETVSSREDNTVRFFHGGTLYVGRDPATLFEAAGELIRDGQLSRDRVDFRFYGRNDIDMSRTQRVISEYDLSKTVHFSDPVPHNEYLQLLTQADVLVLFQAELASICIPAKTFEYLATGKQVLALSPPGATENLLRGFSQAFSADPDDVAAVKEALLRLVAQAKQYRKHPAFDAKLSRITKRVLTGQFAQLLDQLLEEPSGLAPS